MKASKLDRQISAMKNKIAQLETDLRIARCELRKLLAKKKPPPNYIEFDERGHDDACGGPGGRY